MVKDNSLLYRPDPNAPTRDQEAYQVFLAVVQFVDYEHKVCTLQDMRTNTLFPNVSVLPASASSDAGTEVQMPEVGTLCVAAPLFYAGGSTEVGILSYVLSEVHRQQDAIAFRGPEGVGTQQDRKRGTYRKAYPGQKTSSYSGGYSEKIYDAWDRSGRDLTRDKVDADRHEWIQITGRRVEYTDAGIKFTGPVNRPGAKSLVGRTLPDGSQEFVAYLKPGAKLSDRYTNNLEDIIAFTEHTERIQEFALDYPLPPEILQTDLFEQVLGVNADPWNRAKVVVTGGISADDETYMAMQDIDHPSSRTKKPIGPTTGEGATPARRGFILERTAGTLVGYNIFDQVTYGQVLKPVLFPNDRDGRFGADLHSSYLPVTDDANHSEARLAASALAARFPHEYNTTRWDVSKEGMLTFEIGSTIPNENIGVESKYEHPHGAGRSMEGHLVGSLKLVVGKNRDEEDSIDIQAMGQTVLRLGADDTQLPDAGRTVITQQRGQSDRPAPRTMQYWKKSAKGLGDPGDLANKQAFENVSLRAALDGGLVMRVGARTPNARRQHFVNGYVDGQGYKQFGAGEPRIDSHSPGRPTYGAGDSNYAFKKSVRLPYNSTAPVTLQQAGLPITNMVPFQQQGYISPVANPDVHGLSGDLHLTRDLFARVGKNPASGQSVVLDTDGGTVLFLGNDLQGRSITGTLTGGITLVVGQDVGKKGIRLEVNGDVDMTVRGNKHEHITGDYILECTNFRQITKLDHIVTADKIIEAARTRHTTEAPDIVHNQGQYISDENS